MGPQSTHADFSQMNHQAVKTDQERINYRLRKNRIAEATEPIPLQIKH